MKKVFQKAIAYCVNTNWFYRIINQNNYTKGFYYSHNDFYTLYNVFLDCSIKENLITINENQKDNLWIYFEDIYMELHNNINDKRKALEEYVIMYTASMILQDNISKKDQDKFKNSLFEYIDYTNKTINSFENSQS